METLIITLGIFAIIIVMMSVSNTNNDLRESINKNTKTLDNLSWSCLKIGEYTYETTTYHNGSYYKIALDNKKLCVTTYGDYYQFEYDKSLLDMAYSCQDLLRLIMPEFEKDMRRRYSK